MECNKDIKDIKLVLIHGKTYAIEVNGKIVESGFRTAFAADVAYQWWLVNYREGKWQRRSSATR